MTAGNQPKVNGPTQQCNVASYSLGRLQGMPAHPGDPTALAMLMTQVQQLSANQASSQQQMQQMYASQQAIQQQMQVLLAHLQQPQLPPHLPSQSSLLPPPPHNLLPLPSTGSQGISMTPPLVANTPGRSLTSYFPDVKPVLLAIDMSSTLGSYSRLTPN